MKNKANIILVTCLPVGMARYTLLVTVSILFLASNSLALSLQDSIDTALKNNPAVVASRKKVEAADARLAQAVGAFFPTIKIDGNYGRSYNQPAVTQMTTQTSLGAVTQTMTFGIDAAQDSKGYSASFSQPLFVGALIPGFAIAQRSADLIKEDLRRSVLDISYNVTTAYFGVLKAAKMVKLAQESKQMADSHYDQVGSMVSAGVATRADLLRAIVQQANSEVVLTRAKNGLEIAKDAFNNALGRRLEEAVDLDEVGSVGAVAKLPEYKFILDKSYQCRPEWKQYQLSKEIGEQNLRVAQLAYLPMVMLNGSSGNRVTEYPTFKTDVNSWSITGAASWTLFDGLGIQNRIREAAANLDAQKATEEQVKSGIALEVRDAYLNLKSALETIGSAKKAVDSAQENYKVSSLRYSSGVGTNIEELDAQVSLTQAKINYLQTVFDVEIAKAKINKLVGLEVL